MEKAWLAFPVKGIPTRRRRLFSSVLIAALTLGLAAPAQAGLGDLLDPLVEDLPVVGDIVDPIVDEVVDPLVEPIIEDLVAPEVEEVVAPILAPVVEELLSPVVDQVIPAPADEAAPPVVEVVPSADSVGVPPVVPPVEEVVPRSTVVAVTDPKTSDFPTAPTRSTVADISAANQNEALWPDQSPELRVQASFVLAQALQTDLARTAVASPTIAASLVDSSGDTWLVGLTDWLSSTGNRLADLLAIPLRLLEILARALLTAGSGLVAPASLALAFTLYAVRDRRWQSIRKATLR